MAQEKEQIWFTKTDILEKLEKKKQEEKKEGTKSGGSHVVHDSKHVGILIQELFDIFGVDKDLFKTNIRVMLRLNSIKYTNLMLMLKEEEICTRK